MEESVKELFGYLGAIAVAGCLALGVAGSVQASPASGAVALPQQSLPESRATPVHCRPYYHCHRRCWRHRGHYHCRRWCHVC
jgi:hypothetical protein